MKKTKWRNLSPLNLLLPLKPQVPPDSPCDSRDNDRHGEGHNGHRQLPGVLLEKFEDHGPKKEKKKERRVNPDCSTLQLMAFEDDREISVWSMMTASWDGFGSKENNKGKLKNYSSFLDFGSLWNGVWFLVFVRLDPTSDKANLIFPLKKTSC